MRKLYTDKKVISVNWTAQPILCISKEREAIRAPFVKAFIKNNTQELWSNLHNDLKSLILKDEIMINDLSFCILSLFSPNIYCLQKKPILSRFASFPDLLCKFKRELHFRNRLFFSKIYPMCLLLRFYGRFCREL